MTGYLRGQIAKMTNVSIETLRYYEEFGLIPPPTRSEAGYRLYSEEVLSRITFIQNAKSCGFTLREIKKALIKSGKGEIHIADFITVIDKKVGKIRSEIAKKEATLLMLEQLKANLEVSDKHSEVQETLRELHMES